MSALILNRDSGMKDAQLFVDLIERQKADDRFFFPAAWHGIHWIRIALMR